jgi:hypothetical protein
MDSQSNINFFGIKQAHDHRFEMFLKTRNLPAGVESWRQFHILLKQM